jgi:crossover junction endodeoxyribonuclease RuvC
VRPAGHEALLVRLLLRRALLRGRAMTAVVGLDLSLTATGIATPAGVRTIGSKGKADATLDQRYDRLVRLAQDVGLALVNDAEAAGEEDVLVVIEAPAFSRTTGHQHDRSGLWWLIVHVLLQTRNRVVEVQPTARAKYATGKGNAGKDEVLAAVVRRYPDVLVSNNNEADALVLRAMGCDQLGQPLADVPAAHRAALAKVAWPEIAECAR